MKNVPGHDTVLNIVLPKDHELTESKAGNTRIFRSKASTAIEQGAQGPWVLKETDTPESMELRTAVKDDQLDAFYEALAKQVMSEDERKKWFAERKEPNTYDMLVEKGFIKRNGNEMNDLDAKMERED